MCKRAEGKPPAPGTGNEVEVASADGLIVGQLCSAFTLLWDGLSEEWVAPGHFRGGAQICDVFVTQS
jgi:hypothetical protein